jgi:glycosyltransferase involved in cell wall biosynthesis
MLAPISIIIPTYNDAHYLVHCLDSILKQSLLPSEVIVIDDGSKDHSAYDVISSDNFSSLNIKFLKIENGGPSIARNKGFKMANSEYILFLDADDTLQNNILKIYYENILDLPGNYFGISGQMKHFGKVFNASNNYVSEESINPILIGRKGELQGQISCYLFRSRFLKQANCFDISLSHYEDFDLILRLFKLGKLKTINQIALFKRFRNHSLSNKNYRKSFEGGKKFLNSARAKNLLSSDEVLIRTKENHLSYGKQLFLELKIDRGMEQFYEAFLYVRPLNPKEWIVYFLAKSYFLLPK